MVKIYALFDPRDNQPKYIGLTRRSLKERLTEHNKEKHICKKTSWVQSIRAMGLKPWIELIDVVEPIEADFWERHYISLYRAWGFELKNSTLGGDYSPLMSEETKRKLSKAKKAYKFTPEHLENLRKASKARRGKPSPNKGVAMSEEQKAKVSHGLKAYYNTLTPIEREIIIGRLQKAMVYYSHSEETKRKIGYSNSLKRRTPLEKLNLSKPVLQLSKAGEVIAGFLSIKFAAEDTHSNNSKIVAVCKGKRPTHNGYKWQYAK
jgi:hypothetical protein